MSRCLVRLWGGGGGSSSFKALMGWALVIAASSWATHPRCWGRHKGRDTSTTSSWSGKWRGYGGERTGDTDPPPPPHTHTHTHTPRHSNLCVCVCVCVCVHRAEQYGPVCRLNGLHIVYLIVTCPEATRVRGHVGRGGGVSECAEWLMLLDSWKMSQCWMHFMICRRSWCPLSTPKTDLCTKNCSGFLERGKVFTVYWLWKHVHIHKQHIDVCCNVIMV